MTWVLPEPAKNTDKDLLQWANELIEQAVPRQIICDYLLDWDNRTLSGSEKEAALRVESHVFGVMVDRNLNGTNLEAAGKIDEAIELYEKNVSDFFGGDHPYDRLRVIYTKRNQFAEAIRVCTTFVRMADMLLERGSLRADLKPKRDKFKSWIEKLERKKPGGTE